MLEISFPTSRPFRITSYFGPRGGGMHYGVDLITDDRKTFFVGNGTPIAWGKRDDYGNYADFHFDFIDGQVFFFRYAHLSQTPSFQHGQRVYAGDEFIPMGATGNATGIHLHAGCQMKVNINGIEQFVWVDPLLFLENARLIIENRRPYVEFHEVMNKKTPSDQDIKNFIDAGTNWKNEYERVAHEKHCAI